jgi:hypothetical protein
MYVDLEDNHLSKNIAKSKLLFILCNISYIDSEIQPKLVQVFEKTFKSSLSTESTVISPTHVL